MNVVKIQTELLKDALNGKAGKKWTIEENKVNEEVIVMTSHQMWIIPQKQFALDIKTLTDLNVRTTTNASKLLDGYKDTTPLDKTVNKRVFGDVTCIELKLGDESIYVDEKLLKLYDKSVEFEGTAHNAPVYVFEGEYLVGLVLPVKVG